MTAVWGECYGDRRKKGDRRDLGSSMLTHGDALAPTRRGGEPRFISALIAHVDHLRRRHMLTRKIPHDILP
jgi:hypothetical protein